MVVELSTQSLDAWFRMNFDNEDIHGEVGDEWHQEDPDWIWFLLHVSNPHATEFFRTGRINLVQMTGCDETQRTHE